MKSEPAWNEEGSFAASLGLAFTSACRIRSPIPEELRWCQWAADPEGMTGDELLDFANNRLFPTLKELPAPNDRPSRAGVIRGVFEDAYQ